jgi:hypothetical protein
MGRRDSASHAGQVTLLLDCAFSQEHVGKHLLVISTAVEGENAHADGARIGAYVFARRAGRWTTETADSEVAEFGEFGHAFGISDRDHPNGFNGNAQAVKFAPDVYGFALTDTGGGQGVEVTSKEFFAPVKNHYKPVLWLDIAGSDKSQCDTLGTLNCYGYKSSVTFLDSMHSGFFDIEVDETGTTADSNWVVIPVPANYKKLYLFTGDKYFKQGGATQFDIDPNRRGMTE